MGGPLDTPGLDSWLARALHAQGRLPLDDLRRHLERARAERARGQTLARVLVEEGALPREEAARLIERLAHAESAPGRQGPPAERRPTGWRPGGVIDDYELLERLGAGGMGEVFLAQHRETGARYALKSLVLSGGDPELLLRLRREGEAQARVGGHPHVVNVHAVGAAQGRAYLVMAVMPGGDLAQRLDAGPLPPAEAAALVAALARAVHHAHVHGVLHRDLKPANVLFDEAGQPRVVDFGLARVADTERLTRTGDVLGTPAYMAPEQALGERARIGPATDVYGLGALLYACLCGRPPFDGGSVMAVLTQVLDEDPPPPSALQPQVSPDLDAVCLRCLRKAPAERYPDAAALADALEEATSAPPGAWQRLRRRGPSAATAALALLAAAGLVGLLVVARWEPPAPAPSAEAPADSSPPPADAEEPPPLPWSPPADWRVLWEGDPAAARVPRRPLWEDPGRVAAPLEQVRSAAEGASGAAFLGEGTEVRSTAEGLRVRYRDLPAVLTTHSELTLGDLLYRHQGPSGVVDGGHMLSANDWGRVLVRVGRSLWRHPCLWARVRQREHVDADVLLLRWESLEDDDLEAEFHHREGLARISRYSAERSSSHHRRGLSHLEKTWQVLGVESVDGGSRAVRGDESLLRSSTPVPAGAPFFGLSEVDLEVDWIEVGGDLLRPDQPALAAVPAPCPGDVAVGLSFSAGGAGAGGPRVELGPAYGAAYALELTDAGLVLWQGERVLALARRSQPAPAEEAGWILLEHTGQRLRGLAFGAERLELESWAPLGLGDGDWEARYGSGARRVRCRRVVLYAPPPPPPSDPVAVETWRAAAAELATLYDPARADLSRRGETARRQRFDTAADLARTLEGVAPRLGPREGDARTRALLGWILAGRVQEADDALRAELERRGPGGAASLGRALGDLYRIDFGPGLLHLLAYGFNSSLSEERPLLLDQREAALRVARPLVEGVWEARATFSLARVLQTRAEAGGSVDEAVLRQALALLDREDFGRLEAQARQAQGEAFMQLKLWEPAVEHFERALRADPQRWWSWTLRAQALLELGRFEESLRSALGALASNRDHVTPLNSVLALTRVRDLESLGLRAAALAAGSLALRRHGDGSADRCAEMAADLAREALPVGGEDRALGVYALELLGQAAGEDPGQHPAAVLVRVRRGEAPVAELLRAPERGTLRHLAQLDPRLRQHLPSTEER